MARIEEWARAGGLWEGQRRLENAPEAVQANHMRQPFFISTRCMLVLLCFAVSFVAETRAQRNDLTKGNTKKEKTENEALTYDRAIRLYGPPDQEKQMKDSALVCTWIQTDAVVGSVYTGRIVGGDTQKMIIFFDSKGVMTDRKFLNVRGSVRSLFTPDSAFRLDR